jgi:carbonic anhydrase/acetyltransferase-like protein (isoleucine patch superfamily)
MKRRYQLGFYKAWLSMGISGMLHLMARILPGGADLRPFLHRLRGVNIRGEVYIGDDVYIDIDYDPSSVEIQDGVVISPRCTISSHRSGKIVIEKQVAIATGCVIVCAPGQTLTIGEGAVISAGSTVLHDIPPYTLCGGPRIKAFGKVTVPFTLGTTYEEFRRGVRPLRVRKREGHPSDGRAEGQVRGAAPSDNEGASVGLPSIPVEVTD